MTIVDGALVVADYLAKRAEILVGTIVLGVQRCKRVTAGRNISY
jgi:hypothetical protein